MVRYGWRVMTTFGLTTLDVTVISNLSLDVRYCPLVIVTTSGSGLTVTDVNSGAEATPAELKVVTLKFKTSGVTCPSGSIGAVKLIVAPVFGFGTRTIGPVLAVCNQEKLSGSSPPGSVPVAVMLTGAPE